MAVVALAVMLAALQPIIGGLEKARAASDPPDPIGSWTAADPMNQNRQGATATVLDGPRCRAAPMPDYCGDVLQVGGEPAGDKTSAERFDPAVRAWTSIAPAELNFPVDAAVLLDGPGCEPGCGQVLVMATDKAKLYNPEQDTWAETTGQYDGGKPSAGLLLQAPGCRDNSAVGGYPCGKVLLLTKGTTVQLYDPATNTMGAAVTHKWAYANLTATLLKSGKVLIVGRTARGGTSTADLYDPANAESKPITRGPLFPRSQHTATLLPNGKVLLVGGEVSEKTAELYDPGTDAFERTGLLSYGRQRHRAVLMDGPVCRTTSRPTYCGSVLVAGGLTTSTPATSAPPLDSGEIYSPETGEWAPTRSLLGKRFESTLTLIDGPQCRVDVPSLNCGSVLVAGGKETPQSKIPGGTNASGSAIKSSELFDPAAVAQQASVVGLSASSGPPYGGTSVVLNGFFLDKTTSVRFGDTEATFKLDSPTQVTAASPPSATGTVGVTVTTAGGTSALLSITRFEFFTATTAVTPKGSLFLGRSNHTATVLPTGDVLMVGGTTSPDDAASAELFDPATGTSTTTGSLAAGRSYPEGHRNHSATVLPSGKVFVFSGCRMGPCASSELYDPTTGKWSTAAPAPAPCYDHTATLLPTTGQVLVVGCGDSAKTTQLYNPTTNTWSPTGELNHSRLSHRASLLQDGRVLVSGGGYGTGDTPEPVSYSRTAEIYNPVAGTWSSTGDMQSGRYLHSATVLADGRVLVAGGCDDVNKIDDSFTCDVVLATAEIFTPTLGTWSPTGRMHDARNDHRAILLDSACAPACGKVLIVGGAGVPNSEGEPSPVFDSTETYDPATGVWQREVALLEGRRGATLTPVPGGIAVAGGCCVPGASGFSARRSVELITQTMARPKPVVISISPPSGPTFGGTSVDITGYNLASVKTVVRFGGVRAQLSFRGHRLVTAISPPGTQGDIPITVETSGTGGESNTSDADPAATFTYGSGAWKPVSPLDACAATPTASLSCVPRERHTATRLDGPACHTGASLPILPPYPCGKVLVAGGAILDGTNSTGISAGQLYDPATDTWQPTGALNVPRFGHTATLLTDGRVLVVGGQSQQYGPPVGAELYDPLTGLWVPTAPMVTTTFNHTATLLGGPHCDGNLTPTRLYCGKVLVAGGTAHELEQVPYPGAQLFDPATASWSATAPLTVARHRHTATLLADGRVLLSGGLVLRNPDAANPGSFVSAQLEVSNSAEIYDPTHMLWRAADSLKGRREGHSATLLRAGKVLVAGGTSSGPSYVTALDTAELYDPAADRWTAVPSMHEPRKEHPAVALADGRVMVIGGVSRNPDNPGVDFSVRAAEVFDSTSGSWRHTSWMSTPRSTSATLLSDGRVLVAGGSVKEGASVGDVAVSVTGPVTNTELYTPAPTVSALHPAEGPVAGGTSVVVSGTGMDKATGVTIDGAPVPFEPASSSQLTAVSPPHAAGPAEVAVTNAGGTSAARTANAAARFVFIGAPGRVTSLVATAVSTSTIKLAFTAPDDGSTLGLATSFAVRQSNDPITTAAAFDAASPLCGGVCTFGPGVIVNLSVDDLAPDTTYHFALRAISRTGESGELSNDASDTTLVVGPRCPAIAAPGRGQVSYAGGRYSLIGVPGGTAVNANSPLYGWFDAGAGGAYTTLGRGPSTESGRGYWAWFSCPRLIDLAAGSASASVPLGAYHASMVGNPSATRGATVSGYDYAARWDAELNGGAGGYRISGYQQAEALAVGEGLWAFAFTPTEILIRENGS
ncbi:MAG TPA: kelch repeat-containing protein [Acidimicrobiales bacterium]|nr:kelch repeat-containing protein [Acidimicrobiales bacterium]